MNYRYTRVCSCGDVKEISYIPEDGAECRACSRKKLGKRLGDHRYKDHKYTRYIYLCRHCPEVMVKVNKSKTGLCGSCSRKYSKKKLEKFTFSFLLMETICTLEIAPYVRKRKFKTKVKKKKVYKQVGTDGSKKNKVTVRFMKYDDLGNEVASVDSNGREKKIKVKKKKGDDIAVVRPNTPAEDMMIAAFLKEIPNPCYL